MDFSQLPKMSKTPAATNEPVSDAIDSHAEPVPPIPAETRVNYAHPVGYAHEFGFASAWISLIAGLIFLAMGQTFGRWLVATLAGRPFETGVNWTDGPNSGQPVRYFELMGGTAWSDAGLFLMGAALLLDALVLGLLAMRRDAPLPIVFVLVALTALALLLNVAVAFYLFTIGILPIVTLIAILVGGFVVFDHAPLLRRRA